MSEYKFGRYTNIERWSSYWYQINEILNCQPASVLEIGVGDKTVGNYLKTNFPNIAYQSLDNDESLKPDILSTIEDIELAENSFDVVCAFEVLEHMPFEKLITNLEKIKKIARKNVIISLPHWGRHFSLEIRLPLLKKIKWQYKYDRGAINHNFDGQHYWEIGKRNYSLKLVKDKIASAGLQIVKDYVAFELPYHHFFVLKK